MMDPPPKRRREKSEENPNIYQDNADPSEDWRIYGIDRLNLGEPAHDLENNSKWLLAQNREGQMANK